MTQDSPPNSIVLVADDDPATLSLVEDALTAEGVEVAVARHGEAVLQLVGRNEPDLILLDAFMPRLDGFETCTALKQRPSTADIPVIFMTSLNETQYRLKGFGVGAVDYVTKPIEPRELRARVRTHLSLRSTARTLRDAMRALQDKNAALEREIEERTAAERVLKNLAVELERRTEELRDTNVRLEQELRQREDAEAARAELQEQMMALHRKRLLELSAPLIPINDRILVMPLIGVMDPDRARQAVESALQGAAIHRAAHLIIDITGVRTADGTITDLLVTAAKGVGLLGTRLLVTGMRPEIAQILVQQRLTLGGVKTASTLQAGIEYAQQRMRRKKR